jgi:hypothetical protein
LYRYSEMARNKSNALADLMAVKLQLGKEAEQAAAGRVACSFA